MPLKRQETGYEQNIYWLNRAKTYANKSGSYPSKLGGKLFPLLSDS